MILNIKSIMMNLYTALKNMMILKGKKNQKCTKLNSNHFMIKKRKKKNQKKNKNNQSC